MKVISKQRNSRMCIICGLDNPAGVKAQFYNMEDGSVGAIFTFKEGSGEIIVERNILNDLGGKEVTFDEYITAGFGTTEYQADMTQLTLGVDDEEINYSYLGRKVVKNNANVAYVNIPNVNTKVLMTGNADTFEAEEGIAFSPVYHLSLKKTVSEGGIKTCLILQKAN